MDRLLALPWSTIADVVGVLALALALFLARRQVRFGRRLVEIEQARETDRLAAAARAEMGADLYRGDRGLAVLRIENYGAAPARNVRVFMEGAPIEEFSEYLAGTGPAPGFALAARGGNVSFRCVRRLGQDVNHPPWQVRVEWEDDSGEREMETTVNY